MCQQTSYGQVQCSVCDTSLLLLLQSNLGPIYLSRVLQEANIILLAIQAGHLPLAIVICSPSPITLMKTCLPNYSEVNCSQIANLITTGVVVSCLHTLDSSSSIVVSCLSCTGLYYHFINKFISHSVYSSCGWQALQEPNFAPPMQCRTNNLCSSRS